MNLPSSHLDVSALTPKDEGDLRFGVANGVDRIGVSFVRRAEDLAPVRATGVFVVVKLFRQPLRVTGGADLPRHPGSTPGSR